MRLLRILAVSVCTLNFEPHDPRDKVSAQGCQVLLQDSRLLTVEVQACVFEFEISVWSWCLWWTPVINHCFVCLFFPRLLSDCISQFFWFCSGVCQQPISYMLVEFINCQSKYCCFNKRYLLSRCSSPLFWCRLGLAVSVWSLHLFSENELPQQAGGVSFPPGPLFETVRWILSTTETWLEQKQLLLCMSRVWGQL